MTRAQEGSHLIQRVASDPLLALHPLASTSAWTRAVFRGRILHSLLQLNGGIICYVAAPQSGQQRRSCKHISMLATAAFSPPQCTKETTPPTETRYHGQHLQLQLVSKTMSEAQINNIGSAYTRFERREIRPL
ncbi:hypothetical protein Pmar_PMAR006395 [Perkinsus marinus ATCC 50983]|uniref:Uncharacterized protein n=1 Tax=Perkinsus marinus (strain ATCC 50983 / TXsc) TaxID=423536 RepID=C5K9K3_PERM5|nr:hypothetical protein Pmar_PMAR006395 [Perkinsus marinus ATCC 50983]EER18775.1 hypothetical protein Pmar_PMAR006395 [Perkinsus marinus ATCC 50983]|eukprot:XP_002786979.1 hypothetical protein Pmar_PMAR006395 [Perkinsus marinus ATCC 50983]